jgi:alanine dehydrogenase
MLDSLAIKDFMNLFILTSTELDQLIDLDELRLEMGRALLSISLGETRCSLRNVTSLNFDNALGVMPAINEGQRIVGYKAVTVYPQNYQCNLNPHQGLMTLLDYETGQVKCIMDGSTITALRTAAVSAMATDLLARENVSTLALIGAGRQALENFHAVSRVRNFKNTIIFNRTKEHALELVKKLEKKSDMNFEVATTPALAVKDADVVITCTSSKNPLFKTTDLKIGAHVNALGSCRPGYREVEVQEHPKLKIFVDQFEACEKEADEILSLGKKLNSFSSEIGLLLSGEKKGRQHNEEITFFKSVGIAAFDLFAAEYIYQKAIKDKHVGTRIKFS